MLRPGAEQGLLAECARGAPNATLRIAFTRQQLVDNWFSHWHEPERSAIVSLHGWDGGFGVPLEAFLAYEIALHGLRGLGPAWLPERLMHEETRSTSCAAGASRSSASCASPTRSGRCRCPRASSTDGSPGPPPDQHDS